MLKGTLFSFSSAVEFAAEACVKNDKEAVNKNRKKIVTFNMATLPTSCQVCFDKSSFAGQVLDNGAPYSVIESFDFRTLLDLLVGDEFNLSAIGKKLNGHADWQYGIRKLVSESHLILEPCCLNLYFGSGHFVMIAHIVLAGASQCFIG